MIRLLPPLYSLRQPCACGSKNNSLAYEIWEIGGGIMAYV